MKKRFIKILLLLLIFPITVLAEEKDITIESIKLDFIYGNAYETETSKVEENKIINNVVLNKLDDYIDYKISVKNNSDNKYYYYVNQNNSEYVSYELLDEDNWIDKNTEKDFILRIKYIKEIPENLYNTQRQYLDNNEINLIFRDKIIDETITNNPYTGNFYLLIISIVFLVGITVYYTSKSKKVAFLFLFVLLLPITIFALTPINITISNNVMFTNRKVVKCHYDGDLTIGEEYQYGQYTYHYGEELRDADATRRESWYTFYTPVDGWGMALTDSNYTGEVNSDVCTLINDKPIVSMSFMYANSKASHFDLSNMDSSKVTNMYGMFFNTKPDHIDFNVLDTHNVENMYGVFHTIKTDYVALQGIDTSKVTNMTALFYNSQLDSVDMSGLDTSNVTSFQGMFCFTAINHVNLSGFNTSKVKDMSYMFYSSDFDELDLSSFDTSNVTNFNSMLGNCAAQVGYARTEEDAARLNAPVTGKSSTLTFVTK